MAAFGGGVSLVLHLIKILLRLLGCGCATPLIAALETIFVVLTGPLSLVFGVAACVVAALYAIPLRMGDLCCRCLPAADARSLGSL